MRLRADFEAFDTLLLSSELGAEYADIFEQVVAAVGDRIEVAVLAQTVLDRGWLIDAFAALDGERTLFRLTERSPAEETDAFVAVPRTTSEAYRLDPRAEALLGGQPNQSDCATRSMPLPQS